MNDERLLEIRSHSLGGGITQAQVFLAGQYAGELTLTDKQKAALDLTLALTLRSPIQGGTDDD